ncbi:hypothetical protein [Bacillus toyonensis]|uniref:hypothetical protein n=1 Tax=Bacillus toyonensis TaxID=155322 RepID=UPI00211D70EC|nr:hypothetical protein [Bacillus toyonensis]
MDIKHGKRKENVFGMQRRPVLKQVLRLFIKVILVLGRPYPYQWGFSIGYSKGKFQYKKQNRPAYNKAYVNKAARKAGLKVGAKVFWGVGVNRRCLYFWIGGI